MSTILAGDFDFISALIYQRSAIVLEAGKEYLVESRLISVAMQNGFASVKELVNKLRTQPNARLQQQVIEAITTNETSFFRDLHPFEALKKIIIPEILAKRTTDPRLTIWCAAASAGQEPYSIALLLRENFPQLNRNNVRIIATDINTEVLEQARRGCYSQIEVNRGLPASMLVRHFEKHGQSWQLKDEIRQMVEFRECNLITPWPLMPPIDIVFMRNVLIYFDQETKKTILGKVRKVLRPDGLLCLGGAETTMNLDTNFERVQFDRAAFYKMGKS